MATKKSAARGVVKKAAPRGLATPVPPRVTQPTFTKDVTKAVVDVLPPLGYDTNSRSTRYARVMRDIREKVGPGRIVVLATFAGRGGATQVKKAIERGERIVDGDLGDWQLEARRNADGGSTLFCTLVTEVRRTLK